MEINEEITIKNALSPDIHGLFNSALGGHLEQKWSTDEGKKELRKLIDEEVNRIANQGFYLGRKYEQKRKQDA